ncbi:unnamed protein product [Calypogeia fissa]
MADTIGRVKLGNQGLEVSALGLGCMNFVGLYGTNDLVPDENAVKLLHHAYERGVTFFDTSDAYGPHTSEILIGKAIKSIPRAKLQIASKYGIVYTQNADGTRGVKVRGDPEYVRQACEASLKRLDLDYIDLYYQHRVDSSVPIEVTMRELKKLVEEGKIKYIGLSEAAPDTIRRAHAVHPITAIQIEWSLWTRDVEEELVPLCRELGIGIVPYSPLGRGFFSGKATVEALHSKDTRAANYPRFTQENVDKNRVLFERVAALAKKHGCTPGQLALAWVCSQGDESVSVIPIPGTTKIANLEENLGALKVKLTPKDLEEVAAAVPSADVAGGRYAESYALNITWKQAITAPLESWTAKKAA